MTPPEQFMLLIGTAASGTQENEATSLVAIEGKETP